MEPRPQPGRDERGRFTKDDTTLSRAVRELRAVVQTIADRLVSRTELFDREERRAMHTHLVFVEQALDQVDAGERPTTEDQTQ